MFKNIIILEFFSTTDNLILKSSFKSIEYIQKKEYEPSSNYNLGLSASRLNFSTLTIFVGEYFEEKRSDSIVIYEFCLSTCINVLLHTLQLYYNC